MKANNTPILIAIAIPLIAIFVALSLVYFKKRNFSGLDDFPYASYIAAPQNLSGNKYIVRCQPDIQLADLGDGRRVVSVRLNDGVSKFAVLMPSGINISANKRYEMVVRVENGGQISVLESRKY